MAEPESKEQTPSTLWGILWAVFPEPMRPLAGFILYMILCVSGVVLTIALPVYIIKLVIANQALEKEPCWEVREMRGKFFKFNRCTGDMQYVFEDEKTSPPNKPATSP
jgi:hypothetical protein